ncbi:uncharacterized protein LOC144954824, partial [Lampetra fluviatilis]
SDSGSLPREPDYQPRYRGVPGVFHFPPEHHGAGERRFGGGAGVGSGRGGETRPAAHDLPPRFQRERRPPAEGRPSARRPLWGGGEGERPGWSGAQLDRGHRSVKGPSVGPSDDFPALWHNGAAGRGGGGGVARPPPGNPGAPPGNPGAPPGNSRAPHGNSRAPHGGTGARQGQAHRTHQAPAGSSSAGAALARR